MSSLSNVETVSSLQTSSDDSLFINKKISEVNKTLRNIEKKEVVSFSPLKVKICKDKKNQNLKSEIKLLTTFKHYLEDFKKNKSLKNLNNQIEQNRVALSNVNSVNLEQVDSSDLVDSE